MLKLKCIMSRAGKAVKNDTSSYLLCPLCPCTMNPYFYMTLVKPIHGFYAVFWVYQAPTELHVFDDCSCVTKEQQTGHFSLIPRNCLLSPLRARSLANTSLQARNSLLLLSFTSTKEMHIGSDVPAFLITSQWFEVNVNLSSQLLQK